MVQWQYMKIVGHKEIIQFLKLSAAHDKLSHAYLFYGPQRIGKKAVATSFACYLLCDKQDKEVFACGKCDSCTQILKKVHPDVFFVADENKKISIECIRDLCSILSKEPLAGKYKILIVDHAHNLTNAAANSFLKFLEEAPKNTIIILISPSYFGLLETVRSRCQILRFSVPLKTELSKFLKGMFNITASDMTTIMRLSQGLPGLAIEFLQNPDSLEKHKKIMNAFMSSFKNDDMEAKLALVPLILNSSANILALLLGFVQLLIHVKLGLTSKIDDTDEAVELVAKVYTLDRLSFMAYSILQTQQYLRYNVNKRLALENLLINI